MSQSAFILRLAPSQIDHVPEALRTNQIMIGWAKAKGLLDESLKWEQFREIVKFKYHPGDQNYRRAGADGGHLWRFIRDMKVGDFVVVPYWDTFYIGEVKGTATYDPAKVSDDSAYRRTIRWLNNKESLPRSVAQAALISRMKIQGTSATATDLLDSIKLCLSAVGSGEKPTFERDLKARLVSATLAELHTGRIDSYGFEHLVAAVMRGLGAKDVRVVPRNKDKGADVLATFLVAGVIQQVVAIQAKHWQPKPPVGRDVVDQLIQGIEAEGANLGMIMTSGSISDEATKAATKYTTSKGIKIELVDGELFAKLMVEHGIAAR
jgi:predicted Mrr-cat superfamily restriction endonuclease